MAEQDEAIQFPQELQQPPEALDQVTRTENPLKLISHLGVNHSLIYRQNLEVTFVLQNFIGTEFGTVLCIPLLFHHDVGGDAAF